MRLIKVKELGDTEAAIEFKYVSVTRAIEMMMDLPKVEQKRIMNNLKQLISFKV